MTMQKTLSRRELLWRAGTAAGTMALGACAANRAEIRTNACSAAPRPNIVLILADDLGWSDIGCYGGEIETPNIDRIAAQGLRFGGFYNCARCCPTRASLLTGLYPHQAGIGHMTGPASDFGSPAYRGHLNRNCLTLAEALKTAGYRTLMSGKWHVGSQGGMWPCDRGFDEFYGILEGGSNFFEVEPRAMLAQNRVLLPQPAQPYYMTDALTEHAVRLIDESGGSERPPFFLYLSYTAPHLPLHAFPEDIAKYRGRYRIGWDALRQQRMERQKSLGLMPAEVSLAPRDEDVPPWDSTENKDEWDLRMAVYAAMVDRMDQGIGQVLEAVRRSGQEDNTLVMFLSDNGASPEPIDGRPGVLPGPANSLSGYFAPWANASNTPFRRFKHWVHEGGIVTPCVARWPRVIREQGSITAQPGHVMDLMATFVEAAGFSWPDSRNGEAILPLEGRSLMPIFEGRVRAGHEALFWEHQGNRAVRMGDWKLVSEYSDLGKRIRLGQDINLLSDQWELYHLGQDRVELNNLAAREPERVRDMSGRYIAWAHRCGVRPWCELVPIYIEQLSRPG